VLLPERSQVFCGPIHQPSHVRVVLIFPESHIFEDRVVVENPRSKLGNVNAAANMFYVSIKLEALFLPESPLMYFPR
jgi:hypothetical protein